MDASLGIAAGRPEASSALISRSESSTKLSLDASLASSLMGFAARSVIGSSDCEEEFGETVTEPAKGDGLARAGRLITRHSRYRHAPEGRCPECLFVHAAQHRDGQVLN